MNHYIQLNAESAVRWRCLLDGKELQLKSQAERGLPQKSRASCGGLFLFARTTTFTAQRVLFTVHRRSLVNNIQMIFWSDPMQSKGNVLVLSLFLVATIFYESYLFCSSQPILEYIESLNKTGSWANCTTRSLRHHILQLQENHPDSSLQTISCTNIHYRIPTRKLQHLTSSMIVGVLSSASNTGPYRRKSIRSTWAYGRKNVVFIVAGPWEDIVEEYHRYQDLLWVDMNEIYVTENSTLTFKTLIFLSVMYGRAPKGFSFLFKTDDDSYVDLDKLDMALGLEDDHQSHANTIDYWGKCNWGKKPHRNKEIPWQKKWFISYEVYPESIYPPYCQGAGFAVSRTFLDCAVGMNHTSLMRYMPNEDVAVGLLAERCRIQPMNDDRIVIRWNSEDEEPDMTNKIVQHYVTTEEQMRGHHKSVTGVRGPILVP